MSKLTRDPTLANALAREDEEVEIEIRQSLRKWSPVQSIINDGMESATDETSGTSSEEMTWEKRGYIIGSALFRFYIYSIR